MKEVLYESPSERKCYLSGKGEGESMEMGKREERTLFTREGEKFLPSCQREEVFRFLARLDVGKRAYAEGGQ